jgi:predicted CopG family antitoxin
MNKRKTLSIRQDTYEKLLIQKRKGESFNDLIERLIGKKNTSDILDTIRGSVELTRKEKKEILAACFNR